jgi:hypothetical protein
MTDDKDAERERFMRRRAVRRAISCTARESRQAHAQGQPITAGNMRRLLQRNLGTTTGQPIRETEMPLVVQRAFQS